MGMIIGCPECRGYGRLLKDASTTQVIECWLCHGSCRLDTYPMPKAPNPEWEKAKQRALTHGQSDGEMK